MPQQTQNARRTLCVMDAAPELMTLAQIQTEDRVRADDQHVYVMDAAPSS